jgi:hypothetical protein
MSTKNPALIPYMFKDTGRQICVKKVSPMLIMELARQFPAPKPPMQKVDYGDGKDHFEPNPNSPAYEADMRQYNLDFQDRLQKLMIKRGVVLEWTEEMRQEVADLRAFWRETFDQDLNSDDAMVYVLNLCVGSENDLEELLGVIARRSQPTDPAITEALDSFKS